MVLDQKQNRVFPGNIVIKPKSNDVPARDHMVAAKNMLLKQRRSHVFRRDHDVKWPDVMVKPSALTVKPHDVMINPGQVMVKPANLTVAAANPVASRLCLDGFALHHDPLADEVMVSGRRPEAKG